MTGPRVFIVVWGVAALGIGSLFAFKPDLVIRMYLRNLDFYRPPSWLKERMAPPAYTRRMYQVSGVIFMVLGLMLGTLAAIGVIPRD